MSPTPFSDTLKLANAQSVVSGGFRSGGKWAIRFPKMEKIKFCAMVKGNLLARQDSGHDGRGGRGVVCKATKEGKERLRGCAH